MKFLSNCVRRFASARRGNVAVIFALSLVPLMAAAGGGVDFARAMVVRAEMTEALDAAALAVGTSSSLTTAQMQALAQQYFTANYKADSTYGTPAAVTVSKSGQSVTLSTSCDVPTSILKVAGFQSMPVAASTTVVWGQQRLWVAMVLDNTGSMSQIDGTGLSKISALKTASHQLLALLQNASPTVGEVQASIIPFARNVKIGTSYANASWISFADFLAAPTKPGNTIGPGSPCPWSDAVDGFHCTNGPSNGAWNAFTIPNSGSYSGYICPSVSVSGHYWNGCYDSTLKNGKYKHTWIPNDTATWGGCVTDRGMAAKPNGPDYDTWNAVPAQTPPKSVMVAENSPACPGATILPLGYDWTLLNNKVDAMQPNGSTNQTIGLVWGWQTLTQGNPLNPPALPANTQRIIVLLSDGLNTQNRWSGDGLNQSTDVDDRMALACANAKADGITIYAVFVDLGGTQGNSTVLENCASDASKYFDLTSSSQITAAFQAIGQQITNLRVSK